VGHFDALESFEQVAYTNLMNLYLAGNTIIQAWMRQVDYEELAAAIPAMNEKLLQAIQKAVVGSGWQKVEEAKAKVKDSNKDALKESFYKKLINVLASAALTELDMPC
jgi:hypothetical protein